MKIKNNKKLVWLLVLTLILCLIPAAYVMAKTDVAQEAQTVFFYVTDANGKDVLVKAASIEEIRELSDQMPDGQNYAFSYFDSMPACCYAEAKGFTIDKLIDYLNENGYDMGTLTFEGQDRIAFMPDDFTWWSWHTAAKLNVERKFVGGLYEGWKLYSDRWDSEDPDIVAYKEQAWVDGEDMPAILSTHSNSGRTMMDGPKGIKSYVDANNGVVRGCLRDALGTDKALTIYVPTSKEEFMEGRRTASGNLKWIYAVKLEMEKRPAIVSKGTVPAAVPTYNLIKSGDKTLLKVTLTSTIKDAEIYYNDGQGIGYTAQNKYEDPFTIDVTGRDLSVNPVEYYTRTVCEGYDDLGQQTMIAGAVAAPSFKNVSYGYANTPIPMGEDAVLTAVDTVTTDEWSAWAEQISKITLGYPDDTSDVLTVGQYQTDNENKTFTLSKNLFNTTGNYTVTIEALGYTTPSITLLIKYTAPGVTVADSYPMYEDIVLTFNDPTEAYHRDVLVRVNGQIIQDIHLDRSEQGKITIKANYFATGVINEPGDYTLTLNNNKYAPINRTFNLTITPETAGEEPEYQDGVYLLADAEDLLWFARQVNIKGITDINARLTGNIDLNNIPWTPIGFYIRSSLKAPYSGTFDGNGYQIKGLNVNSQEKYQGLFGYVENAVIKNLTVSGQVNGGENSGGIVGRAVGSTIDNCVNKAVVQGTTYTGGIAGYASGASAILNCSNQGSISGTRYVGGICGQTSNTTYVKNCINSSNVYGSKDRVGGITGHNNGVKDDISVDQCVNIGDVSAGESEVGGISGYAQKLVSNCYNTGTVLGEKSDSKTGIGGIAGYVSVSSQVTKCYNIGSVRCSVEEAVTCIGSVVGRWASSLSSAGNYYLQNDAIRGIGKHNFGDDKDATESKTIDQLKDLAPTLGDPYVADTYQINGGYPVLAWQSAIAEDNQEAADAVIQLIDAIGKVDASDACGDRITAARKAFDLLTEDQQILVTNKDVLIAAEAAYAAAVEELEATKEAAKSELDSYKDPADYRDAQQAELADAVAAGKDAIDAATDIAGVNSALAAAKAAIDEFKTDAQLTAEELAAAKEAAKNELESYKNAADYREAQQTELAAAVAAGKSAIDAATDVAGVDKALAGAKAVIDQIKTDAQLTEEERDDLATAKTKAKNELDSYRDPNDYREDQKAELVAAIAAGKVAIDAATDIAGVNSALAAAKAVIDEIKTDAQFTAEELVAVKTEAKDELDSYKNATEYREAQQAELAAAIAAGKAAIDAATDIAGVNNALAAAKAVIDEIKTDAQLAAEEIKSPIEIGDSYRLSKKVLEAMKESGKEVTFVKKENGKVLYSWTFDGSKVDDTISDIDLSISLTTKNKAAIDELAGDENSIYLSFAHTGKLPAPARIKVYVGDKYKDGEILNLYYFNEETKKAEEIAMGLEVKDGYVSFTLTHLSDYFLTQTEIAQVTDKKDKPKDADVTLEDKSKKDRTKDVATGDTFPMAIQLVIFSISLIGVAYILRKKRIV